MVRSATRKPVENRTRPAERVLGTLDVAGRHQQLGESAKCLELVRPLADPSRHLRRQLQLLDRLTGAAELGEVGRTGHPRLGLLRDRRRVPAGLRLTANLLVKGKCLVESLGRLLRPAHTCQRPPGGHQAERDAPPIAQRPSTRTLDAPQSGQRTAPAPVRARILIHAPSSATSSQPLPRKALDRVSKGVPPVERTFRNPPRNAAPARRQAGKQP